MAKLPELPEELADWDPEAPPENPPDELAIERKRRRMKIGLLLLLVAVLVAIGARSCRRAANPENASAAAYLPASTVVNLQGNEVTLLGKPEGPYLVLNVVNSCDVEVSRLGGGAGETLRLVGLRPGYELEASAAALLTPAEVQEYGDRLRAIEAFKRKAISDFCGSQQHFILRMAPATADAPGQIYLLQPMRETNTSSKFDEPNGQAVLVNAWLVREGKAEFDFDVDHPFHERMYDCQLAALIQAGRDREAGGKAETIWSKWSMKPALNDAMRDRMAELESHVR
jgi:hypothetical protein